MKDLSRRPSRRKAGEKEQDTQRARDIPILSPARDANQKPLTLTLSPQGRGEGTRHPTRERSPYSEPVLRRASKTFAGGEGTIAGGATDFDLAGLAFRGSAFDAALGHGV